MKKLLNKLTKQQNQLLWGVSAATVLVFLLLVVVFVRRTPEPPPAVQQPNVAQALTARHPLTGAWLREQIASPRVFGVMIDNHLDARPQSGIDKAFLVIEAPVEAGIPRLIAFFSEESSVEKIGPVRSSRPYFLDWNNEFDALYAHVGGSNAALEKIVSGGTFDLNEYTHTPQFWRDRTRAAPHNMYTSTDRLQGYLDDRLAAGLAPELLYETWQFKDSMTPPEDTELVSVEIDYWAPDYTVGWKFDRKAGRYERSQSDHEDRTLEGVPLMADNVAIVVTDISVLDVVGRREVRTTGQGFAWVLQDGRIVEATWRKPSISQRLKFYVGEQEVQMNSGQTWIEIVPSVHDVTIE